MNSLETIKRAQEPAEHKKDYETPKVETFGSVAKLTMGGGGTKKDGIHMTKSGRG